MKTIISKMLAAVLLMGVVAFGTGCAAVVVGAAAGAGAVVYNNGTLKSQEYASYDQGWSAAMAAMNQLGYAVVGQDKKEVLGEITARATGDKKITVKVRKVSGTVTGFEIRVGTWGDKTQSIAILSSIQKHLNAL